jgi:hypothetical protein
MKKIAALILVMALAACGGGQKHADTPIPGLIAEKRGEIEGPGGCGVKNALLVTEAAGVTLTEPALLTQGAAHTLNAWLATRAIPEIGKRGGGLSAVRIASHYSCRTRNSQKGARLSEHAAGRAIDISAFILADGSQITVEDGWRGDDGALLKRLHASACGPFGTVLGPNSDAHHHDHFHLDVADYRSGAYCR